jgi:hypothetical protein
MEDDEVAALLDSDEPLVVIGAPAGCGKTFQGASYAQREAERLNRGRILILTHTHAACGVFADATNASSSTVEIKTIDSLIAQIAAAYHKSLGLPADPSAWARTQKNGYAELASRVARLIKAKRMIAQALADHFPVVIGDEYQDTSENQDAVVMAMHEAGSRLRIFGDPMQQIYKGHKKDSFQSDRLRWNTLTKAGKYAELENPHRWDDGSPDLGKWVLRARKLLENRQPVNLTGELPIGLNIIRATNRTKTRAGFQLCHNERKPLDRIANSERKMLILTDQNDTTHLLRAFWWRRFPIWEGHTRDALDTLVRSLPKDGVTATDVCCAVNAFMYGISVGYTATSHGKRLEQEVSEGCAKKARDKPALLQNIARLILSDPDHKGAAKALALIEAYRTNKEPGFSEVKIDHYRELREATGLGDFDDPDEALAEFHRRLTYARPSPPAKAISTIHKAKGLQCENAVVLPCDAGRYKDSDYHRCKLYVALSRASHTLTLVI